MVLSWSVWRTEYTSGSASCRASQLTSVSVNKCLLLAFESLGLGLSVFDLLVSLRFAAFATGGSEVDDDIALRFDEDEEDTPVDGGQLDDATGKDWGLLPGTGSIEEHIIVGVLTSKR